MTVAPDLALVATVRNLYKSGQARQIRQSVVSLREFGAATEVPYGSLGKYERGEQTPGPEVAERLGRGLSEILSVAAVESVEKDPVGR